MASQEPFEKHRKLLLLVAYRVHSRMIKAGARSVQREDIYSELCVAWCIARDKWDAAQGVPFGPYLMRGMSNHINRWVDRELRQTNLASFDLDAEMGDKDEGSLHDVLADESLSPEEVLIKKDIRDYARDPLRWKRKLRAHKPLSAAAEKYIDLLENPPPALMTIMKGLEARATYARDILKIKSANAPSRITSGFILDLIGVENRVERADIVNQVQLLSDRVSQQ